MSNICNGKGECLKQTNYDLNKYEKNDLICNHNCQPKKCPIILCKSRKPLRRNTAKPSSVSRQSA